MDSSIVSPLWLHWVKGVCLFRCNLSPALLAEWPGSFTCHCGYTEVTRTPNKSLRTKLTLEKNILLPLLPGFKLATFWSQVLQFYQQAVPAPDPLGLLELRAAQSEGQSHSFSFFSIDINKDKTYTKQCSSSCGALRIQYPALVPFSFIAQCCLH